MKQYTREERAVTRMAFGLCTVILIVMMILVAPEYEKLGFTGIVLGITMFLLLATMIDQMITKE